eukprot:c21376_g1_i1.p1 GENE.c21376_g1_i1~~c21376_g1_i1.p1  ORF type:complete len:640 (-),score=111.90 c21376_g1_i1:42-1961(-)
MKPTLSILLCYTVSSQVFQFEDSRANDLGHRLVGDLQDFLSLPLTPAVQCDTAFHLPVLGNDAIRQLLFLQIKSFKFTRRIYVTFGEGVLIGYISRGPQTPPLYAFSPNSTSPCPSHEFTANCIQISNVDARGFPTAAVRYEPPLDLNKPWFVAAMGDGSPRWSDLFVSDDNRLSVTLVAPLHDANASVVGVVGVDLDLTSLQQFLVEEYGGDDSAVFIVDATSHKLIAASDSNASVTFDNHTTQVVATASESELISAAYFMLLQQRVLDGYTYITPKLFVESIRFNESFGLDWRVVTARRVVQDPTCSIQMGTFVSAIIQTFGCVVGFVSLFSLGIILHYRNRKIWLIALTPALLIIVAGGLLTTVTIFTMVGLNTRINCVARFWLTALSLGVTTLGLLAKVSHVRAVASAAEKLEFVTIRANHILWFVAKPFAVLMSILVLVTIIDPAEPRSLFVESGSDIVQVVVCSPDTLFPDMAIFALLFCLFTYGSWLAFRARHLSGTLVDSRTLMFTFYQGFVIFLIMYGITALSITPEKIASVRCACLFWYSTSSQIAIFLPRVIYQLSHDDDLTRPQAIEPIQSPAGIARAFFPAVKRMMPTPQTVDESHDQGDDLSDVEEAAQAAQEDVSRENASQSQK